MRRDRWLGALLAAALALGCAGSPWAELGTGEPLIDARWFKNGVMVFLGPHGLDTYAKHGDDLLYARFGPGIEVTLPKMELILAEHVSFGGPDAAPVLVRPAELGVSLWEGTSRLTVTVGMLPITHLVELEGGAEGCTATVSIDSLEVSVDLEGRRDVTGRILVNASPEGVTGYIAVPSVQLGEGCDVLGNGRNQVLTLLGATVYQAVESMLTESAGFVADLEAVGSALVGTTVTGRLELHSPGGGGGSFGLVVTANSETTEEPVMIVSSGQLVTPLRVGIDSEPDACAAGFEEPESSKPGSVASPAPDLVGRGADVAIAIRRDVLAHSVVALARSGWLCARLHGADLLTLKDLQALLPDVDTGAVFPSSARAAVRLRLSTTPVLALRTEGDAAVADLTLAGMVIETYVEAWGSWWLLTSQAANAQALGLLPQLETGPGGTRVRLANGLWSVSGGDNPPVALVELAVGLATDGLSVFALPAVYPYALGDAEFELQQNHLVMFANLATEAAPDLRSLAAPVRVAPASDERAGADGCSGVAAPGSVGGLAWGLALLGWLVVRRRVHSIKRR